jgi:hypothetical protein
MKKLASSKSSRVPVGFGYRYYACCKAFIATILLVTSNTITPSCYVAATITLLDPSSSSSSSSTSHTSYDSMNDPKYGRQLLSGYEYYSRLQFIPNNPSLCVQQEEVNYTITIPNDSLPVSLLLTTTTTSGSNDNINTNTNNSTDCTLREKIQNVLAHVEPIGRVRYLIVTTEGEDVDDSTSTYDSNNYFYHEEGKENDGLGVVNTNDKINNQNQKKGATTSDVPLFRIMTLDELEEHLSNNNDGHIIPSHSSTSTTLHNSWMNYLTVNKLSKNVVESLRKKKKKKSNKDRDRDTDHQNDDKNKKDDSHLDVPLYIIHVSLSTQKDIYSYLQQYLLHNDNQFINGGPQISIDTNRHGHHYYNHHNNDTNQTILYMALIVFVAAGSCFILLLFCTNSDWDDDDIHQLNNNQTNTTSRPTRQRLTKTQVREIYPIYRYDGQSKLYRIKVKQQQDQDQDVQQQSTAELASTTDPTDTLRQPLLSSSTQQNIYEEEIIDNIHIDTCSICLDEYEVNDKLRIIPNCQHMYHSKCIGRWLSERSAVCPLCKVNLYIDPEIENDDGNNNTNSVTNNTTSTNSNISTENTNNNAESVTPSLSNDISTSIWHRVIERLFVSPNITTSTALTTTMNPIEATTIPDGEIPSYNQETNTTTTTITTNTIESDIEMSISNDLYDNARSSSTMTRSWWSRMFPSSSSSRQQQHQLDNDATANTNSTMNMLTEPLLSSPSSSDVIAVHTDVETAHPMADTVVTSPTAITGTTEGMVTMDTIPEDATDVVSDVESTFRPNINNNTTTIDIIPNNNVVVHDSNNYNDNGDTGKKDDNNTNDNGTASIIIMDNTDPLALPSSTIV